VELKKEVEVDVLRSRSERRGKTLTYEELNCIGTKVHVFNTFLPHIIVGINNFPFSSYHHAYLTLVPDFGRSPKS